MVNDPQVMQFKVAQILKEPVGATRDYIVGEAIDILDGAPPSFVTGSVHMLRTGAGVLVKGTLDTEVTLVCARCLDLYTCSLSYVFEEEFIPVLDTYKKTTSTELDAPEAFMIDENNNLDITEAARQYAILTIPVKPLCSPDCPGIEV